MGGIGFIESHKAEIMRDSALINLHMIEAARVNGAQRFLFTLVGVRLPGLSAAAAPTSRRSRRRTPIPPMPKTATAGRSCSWNASAATICEDYGLETRVVRFHNIYGELGTYDGGREKSPAAICRKVALAEDGGTIEVWGDGEQTRSYCSRRRLRRRHLSPDAQRLPRAAESRHRPHGHDQRAGRHRRQYRRQAHRSATTT